jgi:hypothetical protein
VAFGDVRLDVPAFGALKTRAHLLGEEFDVLCR